MGESRPITKQTWRRIAFWMAFAAAFFHAAYLLPVPGAGVLMVGFLYGLVRLSEADRPRLAFYPTLLVGIICYGPHLWFFTTIFGVIAVSLWVILALPLGFFVLLTRAVRQHGLPRWVWPVMVPVLWTGIEYLRCEMYYLKFAWMTPGMAMDGTGLVQVIGSYGVSFLMMAWAVYLACLPRISRGKRIQSTRWTMAAVLSVGFALTAFLSASLSVARYAPPKNPAFTIVGVQMEEPTEREILEGLDKAVSVHPDADLLVMSEYSIVEPPTAEIRKWCRVHGRYLIMGGLEMAGPPGGKQKKANTAFVIDPMGEIVFKQVKSVPIQFMDDGIPARERRVWNSPWGKLGICICYDLSYTRVVDDLIRQGVQMLIVPAMDPERWGAHQHELDARVTRVRAAEYRVPIVRVASSGISQVVDRNGRETARAGFGDRGGMVTFESPVLESGTNAPHVPLDRIPALASVVITAGTAFVLLAAQTLKWVRRKRNTNARLLSRRKEPDHEPPHARL